MPPGLDWRAQCAVQDIIAWVRGNFQKLLSKGVGLYVFTDTQLLRFYWHSLYGRPSGGHAFLFCVFTGIVFSVGPPGAMLFLFCVFTGRVRQLATSGGPIFRCTTKDRGERRAKGIAIPLNPRGNVLGHSDVLCACRFATVHLTRLSRLRRSAYPLASACCGCG